MQQLEVTSLEQLAIVIEKLTPTHEDREPVVALRAQLKVFLPMIYEYDVQPLFRELLTKTDQVHSLTFENTSMYRYEVIAKHLKDFHFGKNLSEIQCNANTFEKPQSYHFLKVIITH